MNFEISQHVQQVSLATNTAIYYELQHVQRPTFSKLEDDNNGLLYGTYSVHLFPIYYQIGTLLAKMESWKTGLQICFQPFNLHAQK